ncbi:MAG: hypothetical protein IJY82_00880 [Oscillospiraceae bacterium]|nr:hypothetical protein [Oscillospiraceae bacterium]
MNKMVAVLLGVTLGLLSGCIPVTELDQRGIVTAMGIDREEGGQFTVTAALYAGEDAPATFCTGRGRTVSEAVREAGSRAGRALFYAQNRLLFVGEEVVAEGLEPLIGFFTSAYQCRPNVYVFLCEDGAERAVACQGKHQPLNADFLDEGRPVALGQNIAPVLLYRLAVLYDNDGGCGYLPVLSCPDGESFQFGKTAVFRAGRPAGMLEGDAHRGLLWVTDSATGGLMTDRASGLGQFSAEISQVRTAWSLSEGGITLRVEVELGIAEGEVPYSEAFAAETERVLGRRIERELATLWRETVGAGIDLFDLSARMRRDLPALWEAEKDRIEEYLAECKSEISVECRITHSGLRIE